MLIFVCMKWRTFYLTTFEDGVIKKMQHFIYDLARKRQINFSFSRHVSWHVYLFHQEKYVAEVCLWEDKIEEDRLLCAQG